MTLVNDIRKSVTDKTPVLALVGATDLVVEKVRAARELAGSQAAQVRADLSSVDVDVDVLRGKAQQVPVLAMTKTIELAGKAEETYGDLAARGEKLVERIKRQKATQDLLAQGKVTLSRGKAAVTTVRKAAGDTRTSAKATVTIAKRESGDVVADTQKSVAKRTTGTKSAVKRTTTTARRRTSTAKSTTKAATTSARKTAAAAAKATEAAAAKVGS
jgi:heparin binding hemagglutinin HbhA